MGVNAIRRALCQYDIIFPMPKVSVIIPVYNVKAYLRQCLDSVLCQTLCDIEAVCVDDGSTDGSAAILQEYAANDTRIKVISIPNSGTVVARKRAVAAATGEWCLFLDPDDWLERDACERLTMIADEADVDILQFGFSIHETTSRTGAQRAATEAYFNRPSGDHKAEDLFETIYVRRKLAWNLIGRMVRTDVCKPAFAAQAWVYSVNETDVYATFHIIACARRLRVIADRMYHYRYGVGISTKPNISLEEYRRILGKFDALDELESFTAGQNDDSPAKRAVRAIGQRMTRSSFDSLRRMASLDDRIAGFELLREKCGVSRMACCLADAFADVPHALAGDLDALGVLRDRIKPGKVETVGIYYFHLTIGGIQRVIECEVADFVERGVKVVLFLDDNGDPIEMDLPKGVEIVRLPPLMGTIPAVPSFRMSTLCEALRQHRVDVFHSHQYLTNRLVWDVLACKFVCRIPFYLHYHSVRTAAIWAMPALPVYNCEPRWLRLCDGVFALSAMDASVMAAEGVRAFLLYDPPTKNAEAAMSAPLTVPNGNLVIWVGRLSAEKHPGDAVRIFGRLHEMDATMRFALVGGGDECVLANLREQARQEGIEDVIEIPGSVRDPSPYYARASALLLTSDYEGYSMSALEALSCGVPVVTYEHPQSPVFEGNDAVVQTPPRDVGATARAVSVLLSRRDLAVVRELGRDFVRKLCAFDFAESLLSVFSGGGTISALPDGATTARYLNLQRRALADLHIRRTRQIEGVLRQRNELRRQLAEKDVLIDALKAKSQAEITGLMARVNLAEESLSRSELERRGIVESAPYRVGLFVTWPMRKARDGVKCLRKNGLKYFVTHTAEKVLRIFGLKCKGEWH